MSTANDSLAQQADDTNRRIQYTLDDLQRQAD
jgi:hypothetical protein